MRWLTGLRFMIQRRGLASTGRMRTSSLAWLYTLRMGRLGFGECGRVEE